MRMFMINSQRGAKFQSNSNRWIALWTYSLGFSRTVWINDEIFCTERRRIEERQTLRRIYQVCRKDNVKLREFLFYLYTLKKEEKLSSVQCIDIVWLGNAIIYFVSIAQRSIIFAEVWFNRIFQNGYVEFGMRAKIFFPNFSSLILITDAVNKRSLSWQDEGLRRICGMSWVFSLSTYKPNIMEDVLRIALN